MENYTRFYHSKIHINVIATLKKNENWFNGLYHQSWNGGKLPKWGKKCFFFGILRIFFSLRFHKFTLIFKMGEGLISIYAKIF